MVAKTRRTNSAARSMHAGEPSVRASGDEASASTSRHRVGSTPSSSLRVTGDVGELLPLLSVAVAPLLPVAAALAPPTEAVPASLPPVAAASAPFPLIAAVPRHLYRSQRPQHSSSRLQRATSSSLGAEGGSPYFESSLCSGLWLLSSS
ncbi:hypothetical protein AXF42_Ash014446 [Apostasia shenzhenica]|uniref:Uncharacterized protein n=1 Tax=Apostasia shenzhenica TaxID=1088818 RepID=A0A2H9ZWI1_9ASPA|nr:hypothetical protein AXF42_Ash014446 [Apostasia shenzhenica]